jgi:hypothetical protein
MGLQDNQDAIVNLAVSPLVIDHLHAGPEYVHSTFPQNKAIFHLPEKKV